MYTILASVVYICYSCILAVLVALVVIGTIYDVLVHQLQMFDNNRNQIEPIGNPPPYEASTEQTNLIGKTESSLEQSDAKILPVYKGYQSLAYNHGNDSRDTEKRTPGDVNTFVIIIVVKKNKQVKVSTHVC